MAMFAGAPIQVFKRYLFGSVFTGAPMQPFYPVQHNGYTYPLDGLSVSASAAFSTRKLRSAYAGKCMNVRRSSDNTTQDIGFVNNVLDTASLLAFVGANNGFVVTWYDQSGNAANATQATQANQPQIVASGALTNVAGAPAIYSNTVTAQYLRGPSGTAFGATATSVVGVFSSTNAANTSALFSTDLGGGNFALCIHSPNFFAYNSGGTSTAFSSSPIPLSNTPYIYTYTCPAAINSVPTISGYVNGSAIGTVTGATFAAPANGFVLFTDAYPDAYAVQIPEIVMFKSAISTSDRQTLEHNQEAYYGIAGV